MSHKQFKKHQKQKIRLLEFTWIESINEEEKKELEFLKKKKKKKTWILILKPSNVNAILNRWIFKRKYKMNGTIYKYKTRLRSYAQKDHIDYKEMFSIMKYVHIMLFICQYYNGSGIDTIRCKDCISVWFRRDYLHKVMNWLRFI